MTEIVASIDFQIAQLQRARVLLGGAGAAQGRNGDGARAARVQSAAAKPAKRNLTPEGRQRIAEAVRRRWEAQRNAAAAAATQN
jgi:hypothetical protein